MFGAMSVPLIVAVAILISVIFNSAGRGNMVGRSGDEVLVVAPESVKTQNVAAEVKLDQASDTRALTEPLDIDSALVAELLKQAQQEQAQGKLVEGNGIGAFFRYQKILSIQPHHQVALRESSAIKQYYYDTGH